MATPLPFSPFDHGAAAGKVAAAYARALPFLREVYGPEKVAEVGRGGGLAGLGWLAGWLLIEWLSGWLAGVYGWRHPASPPFPPHPPTPPTNTPTTKNNNSFPPPLFPTTHTTNKHPLKTNTPKQLPTFGLGHSLGAKLHVLLSALKLAPERRRANVLVSFNNFSAQVNFFRL